MSLAEEINNQYSNRDYSKNSYDSGFYVDFVKNEIEKELKILLKHFFPTNSNLTLLEIGAGNGTNSYIFERLGFDIKNISFNELLESRINQIKVNFPNNNLYEGDAIQIPITEKFDIIFQSTVFSSVLNDADRIKLANKMWSCLNDGGIILWYDFTFNNPKNPDVRKITKNELLNLFPNNENVYFKKTTLAPPLGRILGRFCKYFNFSFLKTHILVGIKKN